MKQTLFENKYSQINYIQAYQLLEHIWFDTSENMLEEDFKEITYQYIDLRKQYQPKYLLADFTHYLFVVNPELQNWFANEVQEINTHIKLEKIALIYSKDYISQLSLEQTADEIKLDDNSGFFENREAGLFWLIGDKILETQS